MSFIMSLCVRGGRRGKCVRRSTFCPPLNYYDGDCKSANSKEGNTAAIDHSSWTSVGTWAPWRISWTATKIGLTFN